MKAMIFLGADHRGFELKQTLTEKLRTHNYEFDDLGAANFDADDDYTDIAIAVAEAVAKDLATSERSQAKGILLCGSGAGVCVAANKVRGIRAILADRLDVVRAARTDDDVNVLCLPASFVSPELTWQLVEVFLNTDFVASERHVRRLEKIKAYEKEG